MNSLEKAEDLCRKRRPLEAIPYLEAVLEENPNNLDAVIQLAFLCQRPDAVKMLEKAERTGNDIIYLSWRRVINPSSNALQVASFSRNAWVMIVLKMGVNMWVNFGRLSIHVRICAYSKRLYASILRRDDLMNLRKSSFLQTCQINLSR